MNFIEELTPTRTHFLKKLEKEGKSPNTLKNYKTDLNLFFQYISENHSKLAKDHLNRKLIENYLTHLEKRYSSSNSVRRRIQTLRKYFDFLVEKKVAPFNPAKEFSSAPKQVAEPIPVSIEKIQRLWTEFSPYNHRDNEHQYFLNMRNRALIVLIYEIGLKVSDIQSLTWKRVKLTGRAHVLVVPPKRDPISLPIPASAVSFLKEYKKQVQSYYKANKKNWQTVLFFGNAHRLIGQSLSARGIELLFEEWGHRVSEKISARSLRFSWIIHQLQKEEPESTIKERMGVAPFYSLTPYKKLLHLSVFKHLKG